MRLLIRLTSVAILATVVSVSSASVPGTETITNPEFSIIVPANWRSEAPYGSVKLFLTGDGIGLPAKDKNGPLQAGFTVDKYRHNSMTFDEFIKESIGSIEKDKRLDLLMTKNEPGLELSDGTAADLFIVLMEKFPQRQSLQMKLIIKDHDNADWIVTAWLVGSRKSEIARIGSPEMERMLAHMKTFVFDSTKLDESILEEHYK